MVVQVVLLLLVLLFMYLVLLTRCNLYFLNKVNIVVFKMQFIVQTRLVLPDFLNF